MTVKDLKKLLKDLDDEMLIVTPSRDHSFRKISSVQLELSERDGSHFWEFYGEEHKNSPKNEVIEVVVLS